jgi:hypothetical protein
MRAESHSRVGGLLLVIGVLAGLSDAEIVHGGGGELSTSFSYQGRLRSGGIDVSDVCDIEFRLFNSEDGGTQIGPTLSFDGGGLGAIEVLEGVFSVKLDFGEMVFDGERRFLELSVRCPSGVGGYQLLQPRQEVCGAPYALFALQAAIAPPGLALPLELTVPHDGPLLSLINNDPSSEATAFRGRVTSAGAAIQGFSAGDGQAGVFVNNDADSMSSALFALHGGDGAAVEAANRGVVFRDLHSAVSGQRRAFTVNRKVSKAPACSARRLR